MKSILKNLSKTKKIISLVSILILIIGVSGLIVGLSINNSTNESSEIFKNSLKIYDNNKSLSWYPVKSANNYVLYINDEESDYKTSNTTYLLDDIKPGSYSVSVKAIFKNGRQSISSNTLNVQHAYKGLKIIVYEDSVEKVYDGTKAVDNLVKGVHYDFENALYGDDIFLLFSKIEFGIKDAVVQNAVRADYYALSGIDSLNYEIVPGSITINSIIKRRELSITPDLVSKEIYSRDPFEISYTCYDTGENIGVGYTRTNGELLGYYDILSLYSNNPNYIINLDKFGGDGKFLIEKITIAPKPINDIIISKVYDGTDSYNIESIKKGVTYYINNEVVGYPVLIEITDCHFESINVNECDFLIVGFFGSFVGNHDIYKLGSLTFTLPAKLIPSEVFVYPEVKSKEFGDPDNLGFSIYNSNFDKNIGGTWLRNEGENVGFYNLIGAVSKNPNFSFKIFEQSGIGLFSIKKRLIEVKAIPGNILSKTYDGKIEYKNTLRLYADYTIENLVKGYEAKVTFQKAEFDDVNVISAHTVKAILLNSLTSGSEYYYLSNLEVQFLGEIKPVELTKVADSFSREFGSTEPLTSKYYHSATKTNILITYLSETATGTGFFSITGGYSDNSNFNLIITNGYNKCYYYKRTISVVPKTDVFSKTYDGTVSYGEAVSFGTYYTLSGMLDDYPTTLDILSANYERSDISATNILVRVRTLTSYNNLYNLSLSSFTLNGSIIPKEVEYLPNLMEIQYGDPESLNDIYYDSLLDEEVLVSFTRSSGTEVGFYDIIGVNSSNLNFNFSLQFGGGINKIRIYDKHFDINIIGGTVLQKTYDGKVSYINGISKDIDYTVTNVLNSSSFTFVIDDKYFNSPNVDEAEFVTVKWTAYVSTGVDSEVEIVKGSFKFDGIITPRDLVINAAEKTKKYSEEDDLSGSYYDSLAHKYVDFQYTRDSGESVAKYDYTGISTSNPNYNLTLINGRNKFVIIKNDIIITANDRIATYNGSGISIDVPIISVNGLLIDITYVSEALDYNSSSYPINAGNYEVTVNFNGDENYNPSTVIVYLTINKATSIIVNNTPLDYVYDGEKKNIVVSLNHDESDLYYSEDDFIDAGIYDLILVSSSETDNYKATSTLVTLKIAKKVLVDADILTSAATNITYGDTLGSSYLTQFNDFGYFKWTNEYEVYPAGTYNLPINFVFYKASNYDFTAVILNRSLELTVMRKDVIDFEFPSFASIISNCSLETSLIEYENLYGYFTWENPSFIPPVSGNKYKLIFSPNDFDNYNWDGIALSKDIEVIVSYQIHFNTDGGIGLPDIIVTTLYSSPITQKSNYALEGWYLDVNRTVKVEFPFNVVEEVTFYAQWRNKSLIFTLNDSKTGYIVSKDNSYNQNYIIIPSSFKGLPVLGIAESGFAYDTSVVRITIPESVTIISKQAFFRCLSLEIIEILNKQINITFGVNWNSTLTETDIYFSGDFEIDPLYD